MWIKNHNGTLKNLDMYEDIELDYPNIKTYSAESGENIIYTGDDADKVFKNIASLCANGDKLATTRPTPPPNRKYFSVIDEIWDFLQWIKDDIQCEFPIHGDSLMESLKDKLDEYELEKRI